MGPAWRTIKKLPALIFLDLQIPVISGFEVVRNLTGKTPPIVTIVTASDQHAVQAFEAGAIDYLLRPVQDARLQKALERAGSLRQQLLEIANLAAKIAAAGGAGPRQLQDCGTDYLLLNTEEILPFRRSASWYGSSLLNSAPWPHKPGGVAKRAL